MGIVQLFIYQPRAYLLKTPIMFTGTWLCVRANCHKDQTDYDAESKSGTHTHSINTICLDCICVFVWSTAL